jgi:hypothetical protein
MQIEAVPKLKFWNSLNGFNGKIGTGPIVL